MRDGASVEPGEDVAMTAIGTPGLAPSMPLRLAAPGPRLWWLVLPMIVLFVAFFLVPVASLFAISLDHPAAGVVRLHGDFDTANFVRIFTREIYTSSILRSISIAAVVSVACLVLGYPLAFVIAKTEHAGRNTLLMILVLASMQLDTVIRLYGLMVLMGDNGLINSTLRSWGVIREPLPLMYNAFGVVVGLVQVTLPFMVLSLIGIIQAVHPSYEEAARSLGATRWAAFRHVALPLSMPGILAGTLLVFSLSVSSYVVPALMGGWKVQVLPIHVFQQISEMGKWQFGAAIATVLFVISAATVALYRFAAMRGAGGRA
ncbi:ABC transporter permease [Lichenihabitans sp. Uapishka_5]|uniref:ABC transporter permease n=1 Tax=Lichenihabitans sp. Uapishka_5 TaxID=3037302 RepID=UPI0029E7F5DB|nr:ABC transporter permease [Lichenihabitans sp. Uapishka_5]MDX7952555.1 ABC transporter permease [Lichenihabitans sp. Uapishka_5]